MTWCIEVGPDEDREDEIAEGLVEHNKVDSVWIRLRFEPDNLPSEEQARERGCRWSRFNTWEADRIIRQHVRASVGAAALPWADLAAAAALYANMGRALAKAYDADADPDAIRGLARSMATGVAAVVAAWFTMMNIFKFTGVGYVVSWAVEAPLLSGMTYAVGNTWKYYFRTLYIGGMAPSEAEMRKLVMEDLYNRLRKVRRMGARMEKPRTQVRKLTKKFRS